MTTTLTPTCSFCGLAFANRPMLELHIREDHVQRGHAAERGQDDPSGARAGRLHAGGPDRERGEPATPPSTNEVTTVFGTPPRHRLAVWAVTALRRVACGLRHANADVMLASELMFRSPGAPRPRRSADAAPGPDTHAASTGPAGKAA